MQKIYTIILLYIMYLLFYSNKYLVCDIYTYTYLSKSYVVLRAQTWIILPQHLREVTVFHVLKYHVGRFIP